MWIKRSNCHQLHILDEGKFIERRKVHSHHVQLGAWSTCKGKHSLGLTKVPSMRKSSLVLTKRIHQASGWSIAGFSLLEIFWSFDTRNKYTFFLCSSSGVSGIENLTPKLNSYFSGFGTDRLFAELVAISSRRSRQFPCVTISRWKSQLGRLLKNSSRSLARPVI